MPDHACSSRGYLTRCPPNAPRSAASLGGTSWRSVQRSAHVEPSGPPPAAASVEPTGAVPVAPTPAKRGRALLGKKGAKGGAATQLDLEKTAAADARAAALEAAGTTVRPLGDQEITVVLEQLVVKVHVSMCLSYCLMCVTTSVAMLVSTTAQYLAQHFSQYLSPRPPHFLSLFPSQYLSPFLSSFLSQYPSPLLSQHLSQCLSYCDSTSVCVHSGPLGMREGLQRKTKTAVVGFEPESLTVNYCCHSTRLDLHCH